MKRLLGDLIATVTFWIKEAWEFRQKKRNEKCILRIIIETITDMRYL
jgi:hypothetical protein